MEIWKDVVWYEWLYQVSNMWNVKSLIFNKHKILKTKLSKRRWNYVIVILFNKWVRKNNRLHRLVWLAFIVNENKYKEINHKDWNKLNNCVNNLEWCNRIQNEEHKYKLWLQSEYIKNWWIWIYARNSIWEKHPRSKKVNQYDLQWNFIKTRGYINDAWITLNIRGCNISSCCKWKKKTAWWFIWKYSNN